AGRQKVVYRPAALQAFAPCVAALGPGPSVPDAGYTAIPGICREGPTRGGDGLPTHCTARPNSIGAAGALRRRRFAPAPTAVEAKHIDEAMLTWPQQMPVFSDQVISPEDKRAIIAYIKAVEEQPDHGGFSVGGFGPVGEGVLVFLVGTAACVAASIWITSHGVRVR